VPVAARWPDKRALAGWRRLAGSRPLAIEAQQPGEVGPPQRGSISGSSVASVRLLGIPDGPTTLETQQRTVVQVRATRIADQSARLLPDG